MEKTPSVQQQQKKASKQPKAAANGGKSKKQLKVVYICSPLKVETSPSEFRALVQELTGQDADVPDPFKFPPSPSVGAGGGGQQLGAPDGNKIAATEDDHSSEVGGLQQDGSSDAAESSDLSSETAPDYVPQLIENFPGIMPSNMWYD